MACIAMKHLKVLSLAIHGGIVLKAGDRSAWRPASICSQVTALHEPLYSPAARVCDWFLKRAGCPYAFPIQPDALHGGFCWT